MRHIYQRSSALKHLITDDGSTLLASKKYFSTDCEKAIQDIRTTWREANGISDDATVLFFDPGNELKEAQFTTICILFCYLNKVNKTKFYYGVLD